MIFSLIKVGLLCIMGVGANKPTPINYNGQPQHNYKQKNNANETSQSAVENFNIYPTTLIKENYWATEDDELADTEYYLGYTGNFTLGNLTYYAWNYTYLQHSNNTYNLYYEDVEGDMPSVYALKLTTNTYINAQNITFSTRSFFNIYTTNTPNANLQVIENYHIIQSTNTDFETLYNLVNPNGNTNGYPNGMYRNIKQNMYSSSWTENTQSYSTTVQKSTLMTYDKTTTVSTTIQLQPRTTNYIFIFKEVKTNFFQIYPEWGDDYNWRWFAESQNRDQQPSIQLASQVPHITGTYTTADITVEVIDIPGIMWEILTMPFSFISTAFNLTLFPGTNYAVNISNLILTIFGVLVFIFIFKTLIKHK